MKIVVVGGGVAGLVAALSLRAAGMTPVVCESARELRALGVGINLLPHAVRELTELGLGDALDAIALPPERLVYCDRRGRPIRGSHWVWRPATSGPNTPSTGASCR